MMGRRLALVAALALLLTCGPTAVPRPDGNTPSATAGAIASTDVITLREGGADSALALRKVASGELVRSVGDGTLLPDGTTLISVSAAGASSTLIKKIDRRTGVTVTSRTVDGNWQSPRTGPGLTGLSADGSHVVLFGSSYNYTDASGAWTARTTFGIVDLASWHVDTVQLEGRYSFEAISNDGSSLYLGESLPVQLPTGTRLRVYDVGTQKLTDVGGDVVPDLNESYRTPVVNAGVFSFSLFAGKTPMIVRFDLAHRAARLMPLPAGQAVEGELMLMWSLVPTRDGRTLYAINPAAGVVDEIDTAALTVRRTARLDASKSEIDLVRVLAAALHPIADAKMGFATGAVLSSDESTLFALAETGLLAVDTVSLTSHRLTNDRPYESLRLSPDGRRIYVLGREDGVITALDARDGSVLGRMPRIAFPSEIVAVDAN